MKNVINKLATSLGRRDDKPNQELAKEIAVSHDRDAVTELIALLKTSKDKRIQSDCLKTLYEIGYVQPELIAPHIPVFVDLLNSKNNRLVWGAMIALDTISQVRPKEIFAHLPTILEATDKGSVITKDHGIGILIHLSAVPEFENTAFDLLMEQLRKCAAKQLPLYAERCLPVIHEKNKERFLSLLKARLHELPRESQKKRIEKVMRTLA